MYLIPILSERWKVSFSLLAVVKKALNKCTFRFLEIMYFVPVCAHTVFQPFHGTGQLPQCLPTFQNQTVFSCTAQTNPFRKKSPGPPQSHSKENGWESVFVCVCVCVFTCLMYICEASSTQDRLKMNIGRIDRQNVFSCLVTHSPQHLLHHFYPLLHLLQFADIHIPPAERQRDEERKRESARARARERESARAWERMCVLTFLRAPSSRAIGIKAVSLDADTHTY